MTRVLVFGYGELGVASVDILSEVGSQVVGLVVPFNRSGVDVEIAKSFARERNIPVLVQPSRKRIAPFINELHQLRPDFILVWSYSMILPPDVISIPTRGCVNMHGGLLPEYRGGHVLGWAIVNGESETGMTMHYLDEGVDTGPVIAVERFPIEWEDDALSLRHKLKKAGTTLLGTWWPKMVDGTAPRVFQDESKARYWRLRTPEDGIIDWASSSLKIYNVVRAHVRPWHGAFTYYGGEKIIVWQAVPVNSIYEGVPGQVLAFDKTGMYISTGQGTLLVVEMEKDGAVFKESDLADAGIQVGMVFSVSI